MIMHSYIVHFIVLPGLNKVLFSSHSLLSVCAKSRRQKEIRTAIESDQDKRLNFVPSIHNLHNKVSEDFETILVFAY